MNDLNNEDTAVNLPAVAVNEPRSISSALSVGEILRRKQLINEVMDKVMVDGTHYGPGFPGDTKKNLLKPGAETLLSVFQLVPCYIVDERQYDGGHREYRITVHIKNYAGMIVGEGLGTASTLETKHRYRNAKPKCQLCGAEAIMRSKYEEGWYCNAKAGGCNAKFPLDAVTSSGKVENPDPADVWNTCLKMSGKRALVHGCITALGVSDIFAQDAEDLANKIDDQPAPPPPSRREVVKEAVPEPKSEPKPKVEPKAKVEKPASPPTPAQIAARALAAESKDLAALVWDGFPEGKRQERLEMALTLVKDIDRIIPPEATKRLIARAIFKFKAAPAVIDALGRISDGEVDEDLFDPVEEATTAERASASGAKPPF